MKFRNLTILVCIVLTMSLYSCSQGSSSFEKIIGSWKVVDYEADMKDLSPSLIASAKELALKATYEFKKDSTFTSKGFRNINGTWSVKDGSIIMKFSSEYERNAHEGYEIQKLNSKEMVWFSKSELGTEKTILSKK